MKIEQVDEVKLDIRDFVNSLAEDINRVPFVNSLGERVYIVSTQEVDNSLAVELTDGSKFNVNCEKS